MYIYTNYGEIHYGDDEFARTIRAFLFTRNGMQILSGSDVTLWKFDELMKGQLLPK